MILPLTSAASDQIAARDSADETSVDAMQVKLLELLNLYKQCGINTAKAYVYCDDSEENYCAKLRDKCEQSLNKINNEMQSLMQEAERIANGHNVSSRFIRDSLRARTSISRIPTGTLESVLKDAPDLHEDVRKLYDTVNTNEDTEHFQARHFAPFKEMWEVADQIIDPNSGASDANLRLGEDLFLTRTDLKDVDPISKQPYVDVVRALCGHHFSKQPLLAWLNADTDIDHPSHRSLKACPQCKRPIRPSDLVPDQEWEARVKESAKRAQMTQMRNAETIE